MSNPPVDGSDEELPTSGTDGLDTTSATVDVEEEQYGPEQTDDPTLELATPVRMPEDEDMTENTPTTLPGPAPVNRIVRGRVPPAEPPPPRQPPPSEGQSIPEAVTKAIQAATDHILEAFEAKLAYDATKQQQVDRLHEELQQHRSNLVEKAARPLVLGLVRLYDDIDKVSTAQRRKPPEALTPDRFYRVLEDIQDDVELLLGQNGFTAFRESTEQFDPHRQRILEKWPSANEADTGRVAKSLRPGFEKGTEIIEKERVAVYVYDASAPAPESPTGDEVSPPPTQNQESDA